MNYKKIYELALDCIFPRKSIDQIIGTKKAQTLYTSKASDVSEVYKKQENPISPKIIVASDYKLIKPIIYNFKYQHHKYLGEKLGSILSFKIKQLLESGDLTLPDLITFVPADPKRLKLRGFNSPQVLADFLANELNVKCEGIFEKVKHTKAQAGLNKTDRERNLIDVFTFFKDDKLGQRLLNIRTIYLVDDVIASGQTVEKLANLLYELAPGLEITIIALARNEEF